MSILKTLKERGYIENQTHEAELEAYLEQKGASCYIGFDPTADSLHVGHLIPIMSLAHMQRQGFCPIALVGGGTGMIGDPSGRTEMRKMMTARIIQHNVQGIKDQLSRFIDFNDSNAILANNALWLSSLEYVPFLRDIGRHFSINRMIKAESYCRRIASEEGLSFIEFNYMLLQAYDFLKLSDLYGCSLQMGGSDQWGNILAGVELVRKMRHKTVFGITFQLITKSDGSKMGKSASGAVWLDPDKTSPYEYYQFWINTDDRDLVRFISLFTFLPMQEIQKIGNLTGCGLNFAKEILAFEATALAHGREEALKARAAAGAVFGSRTIPSEILPSSTIVREKMVDKSSILPATKIDRTCFVEGMPAYQLFYHAGLTRSAGEARRLLDQGGGYVNGLCINKFDQIINTHDIQNNEIVLRAGKKRYHRIDVSGK